MDKSPATSAKDIKTEIIEKPSKATSPQSELPLFMEAVPSEIEEEIRNVDANDLTPRMALDLIYAWQKKLR